MIAFDIIATLRARWRIIAAITAAILLAVGLWSLTSSRVYQASATLLIDAAQQDPVETDGSPPAASSLGTQADILRSSVVAERVIEKLKLDQDPKLRRQYESADRELSFREWLAGRLTNASALEVTFAKSTNVLTLTYKSGDPQYASRMANAFAQAFVEVQLELKTDPAKVYSRWFENQIRDYRQRLETAQARLTAFQQQQGLVGAQKIDVEMARLSELSAQVTQAQAELAQASARAGSSVGSSSEAQMGALVQTLDGQIAAKSAEVQQMRQSYGPNHPALVAAVSELSELRARRGQAVGTAVSAVRANAQAAGARVGEIQSLLNAQRQRVLTLSGVQDRMAVYQRDVDAAQKAYDAVTDRLNQVRLVSEVPQTNVALLDRAVTPTLPSSPNIPQRMVLGLIVGLLLGVSVVLAKEWFSPRVRSVEGLATGTLVPVLADLKEPAPNPIKLPLTGKAA